MRKAVLFLLSIALLFSLPVTVAGASNLTTEQKFQVLKENGIFTGFSDGSSRLYQSMTREQFAVVLVKLFELPETTGSPSYVDVLKTKWSYKYVQSVTKAGLMSGIGNRKFAPESPVTVEQLCSILVRSYGFTGTGTVSGKVSGWARASVGIALKNGLIPAMKDYTLPATRGLLVEAAYVVFEKTRQEALKVRSVDFISSQIIRVNLLQSVSSAAKERFTLKDILGVTVNIQQAILSPDGLSVTLVTDRQASNRMHTLFVDGAAYSYTTPSDDTVKPTVASFNRLQNGILQLVFSEPVERSSAINASNYTFNNGLRLATIQLSDDNRVVTMTTSQTNNNTTYTLTVRNVKDLAGNVINAWSSSFQVDNMKPTATFAFNPSTAVITVTFSEKVNAQQAVATNRYSIDKGVVVVRADLDANGKTVYLRTSAQQDATLYTLTVSGIADLAGNVMNAQSYVFAGVSNPVQPAQLQSIVADNENTLRITFNRALSDADVNNLRVAVLTDNGNVVSMGAWDAFYMRAADRVVTVQFRVRGTPGDNDPTLFRPGHVYTARVSGVANLITDNNANQQNFAGTERLNPIPYVTTVVPINDKSVRVTFSEPVKNVSKAAFVLKKQNGETVTINGDSLNNTGKITTEVVLTFTNSLPKEGYVMTFVPNTVTDAAGWNFWKTRDGDQPFFKTFTIV